MEDHLAGRDFIVGDQYSIADISAWGWVDKANVVLGDNALDHFPNLKRWFAAIDSRPAVQRARSMASELSFKTERDEDALRALFPSNYA